MDAEAKCLPSNELANKRARKSTAIIFAGPEPGTPEATIPAFSKKCTDSQLSTT